MSFDKSDLTKEEKAAVTRMGNAMKVLSKRHWFFAASGNLILMRLSEDGKHALKDKFGGMDQDYSVCDIGPGSDVDCGDW